MSLPAPAGFELINPENNEQLIISGLNWYSYTENNPVKYVDPTGKIPAVVISAAVGGAVGAGTGAVSAIAQGNTSLREIAGGAAGGAISGAVTGALVGSGVGIPLVAGGSAVGGAAGSVVENLIAKGPQDLDAKAVAKDAAIDGVISAASSLIIIGMGKGATILSNRSSFSPKTKKFVTGVKTLAEGFVGTVADVTQDKVNPPSTFDSGKEINGGNTGADSAQDNANSQETGRKIPKINAPPSNWPRNYPKDD